MLPNGPIIADFAHSNTCTADDCEDPAERTFIFYDPEDEEMIVCHLCLPHTIHHRAMFERREAD